MAQLEVLTGERDLSNAGVVVRFGGVLPGDGGKISLGQAVWIEEAGEKPPYSIYAAIPEWENGTRNETAALASCCRVCLRLAREHGTLTVDFLPVTGGYPVSQAASVMEKTAMDFLREQTVPMRVRFVCESQREAEVYRMTYNLLYAETKEARL